MADWEEVPSGWEEVSPTNNPIISTKDTGKYSIGSFDTAEPNWIQDLATKTPGYEYGTILPFKKNLLTGKSELAAPDILKQVAAAIASPGLAQEGLIDYNSPEAVQQALNLGGMVQLGSFTRNALRKGEKVPTIAPKDRVESTLPDESMPLVFRSNRASAIGSIKPGEEIPTQLIVSPKTNPAEQVGQITAPMAATEVAPNVGAVAAPRAEPINLKQFSDPAAKILEDTVGAFTPEQIAYAKRGKIDFNQAQALADATGHNVEYFLGNRPGSVYNAETLQRFGNLVDNSTKEIAALAEKAISSEATSADLLAFKESQLLHSALVNRFIGASSEAGRTLNQLRANKGTMDSAKYLEKAIDQFGGTDKVLEMAKIIAQASKDGTLKQTLAKGQEFKWSDAFLEAWKAGLLTGVKTQVKNVVSNTYSNLMSIPERATSATIGTIRSAITGSNDKVSFREVAAMTDAWRDLPNAMSNFGKALANEDYLMTGGGKGDVFQKAITAENFRSKGLNIPAGGFKEKLVENTGKFIRAPFRILNATDIGYKSIAAHQQLRALAARDAAKAGLKGEAFDSFMADRLANPSKAQMEAAMDWAHYLTYTKELGKFGRAFQSLTHSHPALQAITPFTATPINLAKFFVERTPLQFLSRTTRDAIKRGGAEADMALGKIAVGTGIMWGLGEAVQNNVISMPYSLDPNSANLEYQAGYRPFAIKTDTGYVPIDNIDPLGSMVAMSAGLVALDNFYRNDMKNLPKLQQINKLTAYAVDTMNNVFVDKTYAQGVANAIESAKSEHGMQQFLNGLAKSTTPTLIRDIVSVNDPTTYTPLSDKENLFANVADKTWQATKATLPFVDKTDLNQGLDMWGQPRIKSTASIANPWKESPLTSDKATIERIKYGITIPNPIEETKAFGADLNESDQKYWKQLQGGYAKVFMTKMVNSPLFEGESTPVIDLARKQALQQANQSASQLATAMLEVQKGLKEKDTVVEEMSKKIFPRPKRKDIVE
jgi:hypothetical protein